MDRNTGSSFLIHDDHGNVWPPQFRSQLCDPTSPHTMLTHNMRQQLAAANKAREHGKGWGTGAMEHMQKPLLSDKPSKPFRFHSPRKGEMSSAEIVWRWLGERPGQIASIKTASSLTQMRAGKVTQNLSYAVQGGVLDRVVGPDGAAGYVRGAAVPVGVEA